MHGNGAIYFYPGVRFDSRFKIRDMYPPWQLNSFAPENQRLEPWISLWDCLPSDLRVAPLKNQESWNKKKVII